MAPYALTIFLGAFLLFQVQPLIGKYILPWFGGGPGVWTTCMLFFQVVLLAGYAYAHALTRWFKPRGQAVVHWILLAASLVLLPIIPGESWKHRGGGNPTLEILGLLGATLGLPYFILSSTGPLLQQWFSRTRPGSSPYRLYALSNAGSLLALISYPVLVETHFTRKAQAAFWSCGLVGYVVFCAACAWKTWKAKFEPSAADSSAAPSETAAPGIGRKALWLLLPASASVLLLATTNKLCQDVAVIPFLWVLPLALYLLSFIICFDSPKWYRRGVFALALVGAVGGICWAISNASSLSIHKQVGLYSAGLFICCMVCHGEVYRLRPDPRHLTGFYLMIAAGGAIGGILVAVVAPLVFSDYFELQWGLALCCLSLTLVCAADRDPAKFNEWRWLSCALTIAAWVAVDGSLVWLGHRYPELPRAAIWGLRAAWWGFLLLVVGYWIAAGRFGSFRYWRLLTCLWLGLALPILVGALWAQAQGANSDVVDTSRNFYGVLKVFEQRKVNPKDHNYLLVHGRITHGLQFVDAERSMWATSYYGEDSGISLAVNALPPGPRKIGVIGLGTGTMAVFARTNDAMRIYEINPEVRRLATSRFSYVDKSPGQVEVVMGDARLSMEAEAPQQYDMLALDAFSSDAIPVHLLTRESFALYQRHLKTNGIIVLHISNRYLNLEPVVVNLAREFGYHIAVIDDDNEDGDWWTFPSTWVILSRNPAVVELAAIRKAASTVRPPKKPVPLWTDDFASLFQILK
jgi:hypothetical protein